MIERPSIAIIYDVAYPFVAGGGQRRMYEIARRLADSGWNVHWHCLKTWQGDDFQQRDGISYHGLKGNTDLYVADGSRSRRAALSFGRAIFFSRTDFSSYEIVWCGQWPLFHIMALCARLVPWRTQLVVDWWEVWGKHWGTYGGWPVGTIGRWIEKFLAQLVTRVGHAVVISNQGAKDMVELGASSLGLTLIPNGVNVDVFERAPVAEGAVDIVSFGRIKDHKNIDHVVRAIAIAKERGQELTGDIIGEGPELARIKRLAIDLGVSNQITFHGEVTDERLRGLLKRAKIFVHPSTKEAGGSITLLEANACGIPVVCYRHPLGIDPTLIRDRETGLLVAEVGSAGLASGIAEMLDLAKSPRISNACIEHARAFDWGVIANSYRRVFEEISHLRRRKRNR